MAPKAILAFLLIIKTTILSAFIAFHFIDLKKGISAGWSFNNFFLAIIGLPLLALLAFVEVRMLGDKLWPVKLMPVWAWLICALAVLIQPNPYFFQINIVLLSLALLLTMVEGLAYFGNLWPLK